MRENQRGDQVSLVEGRYVSKYFKDSKETLEDLNAVSPSFCLAKWFNVSIHIPTGQTHSCYHPQSHAIPLDELAANPDAIHNTSHKIQQRHKMLEGERPKECSYCWDIEDQGNISDRAYRSNDVQEEGLIQKALDNIQHPTPRYMEVNFNQACNFKCAYCSPHLSTEWLKEVQEHGGYKLSSGTHNDKGWVDRLGIDNSPDNPYVQSFWEWWPTVYKDLKTFRMTGGEPLMDKNTFRVFDYVKQNPNPELNLCITSNCCPPGNQWNKFMDAIKEIANEETLNHFQLYCSLDTWGEQAEYIRNGLDYEVLRKNIIQFLTECKNHSLGFIITSNLLSLPNWCKFIETIHELRCKVNKERQLIWFDTPMLHHPNWLSMRLATPEMLNNLQLSIDFMEDNKETSNNRFKGFKDFEIDKVRRLYDWAKQPFSAEEDEKHKIDFYLFFTEHDKRRNTNFTKTFPTMIKFMNQCKEYYEQRR